MTANRKQRKLRRGQPPRGPHGKAVSSFPPLTVRIPPETKRQLEELSAMRHLPMWMLVDRAILAYVSTLPEAERRSVGLSKGKRGLRQFGVPERTQSEVQAARIVNARETPQMALQQIVAIPLKCEKCSGQMEIHCQHSPGFGYMGFYLIECPHCLARLHPQLPGDIVAVHALEASAAK